MTINKNYAENYDRWRGGEELQKLKDRYGDLEEEEESSTSEEEWTEDKEKEFFKTFSLLKKKDPKIYDSNVQFFQTDASPLQTAGKKDKKDGKVFLIKDHERKMLLENGADYEDKDDVKVKIEPSYVEEQANIKKGFSDALKTIDSDEEGDNYMKSDLLKKRKKTFKEEEVEQDDYRQWLKGEVVKIKKGGVVDELKFLKEYWNDPNLNADEKFLRDYILNRKYQDVDDSNYIPTYDEVVHDSDDEGLSGDEQNLQKMEEFEHKYNFRFEEPDQDFIKRYPRTVESSLRRSEDKRKRQREAAKERKDAEKEKKREEIQRLKALKRNEILEKLKQLESITGDPKLTFEDEDIEGDFDPEAHDRKMQKIFSDEFYGQDDEEKPVFPSDEELDEEWKAYCPSEEDSDEEPEPEVKKSKKKKKIVTNSDNEDLPQEPVPGPSKKSSVVEELIEASKGRRGKKKKTSVFLEALERSKPKFNPELHQTYEDYFDEYYKLDFEDLIGDIPCRFKYRKVTPNSFGLNMNEILNAPDRELNQWSSLRKTYQYRTPEEENYDLQAYEKKASSKKKQQILPSLYIEEEENEEEDAPPTTPESSKKKKKNKKKKKKPKADIVLEVAEPEPNVLEDAPAQVQKSEKKKKKKKKIEATPENAEFAVVDHGTEESPSKLTNETKTEQLNKLEENGQNKKFGEKRKHNDSGGTEDVKAKKKKHKGKKDFSNSLTVDDDRLRAYGINPTNPLSRKFSVQPYVRIYKSFSKVM
ncbi:unnamed protein product [Allacma fusca]|uniref:Protein KRI1 homolog n=1 Tax=Allacma fusca TaxID=39272 RepID=A0A8J2PIC0_9HEXA|nr:unnamed protein product [Allacma fusca]